ncbi:hypothetical protein ABIF52_006203 [Bradyrhizobium japonicum]
MKNFEIMAGSSYLADACGCSIFVTCGFDLLARDHPQQPRDHDAVVRLQPALDHAQAVIGGADLHLALLDDVVAIDHQQIAAALVAAERGVGNEERALLLVEGHADADEIAGQQHPLVVGDEAAHGKRTGRLVESRRDVVELAFMRIAGLVLEADLNRKLLEVGGRQSPAGRFGADA